MSARTVPPEAELRPQSWVLRADSVVPVLSWLGMCAPRLCAPRAVTAHDMCPLTIVFRAHVWCIPCCHLVSMRAHAHPCTVPLL